MATDTEPRLFPASPNQESFVSSDRDWIIREVQAGLRNHRARLAGAIENQSFYDLDSDRYATRREAETEFDFAGRPRRQSGLMLQAVDRLCEHTYNPGPTRKVVGDGLADSLLKQVYEDNHIDALMGEADAMAAVNDVCAIEFKATNDKAKPIDLQIWGGDEFTVFVDPEDPRCPTAVVTIDRYNERTRYKLYFDDVVYTYLTDQYSSDKTAGARVAKQTDKEVNSYGCIPFTFLHYRAPVRQFWTPGPGTFLRKAELRINDRLSELDELIMKYGRPIGVFKNVGPAFTPEIGPGRFMRLNRGGTGYTGDGYADGGEPSAEYLQATLAIESIWLDLEKYIKQTASAINLPWNALELEYGDAPSGITPDYQDGAATGPGMQAAEDLPDGGAVPGAAESSSARGTITGRRDSRSKRKRLAVLLAWAEPRIPVPGPDRDQSDEWEMQVGIKSRITVCMERYGLDRDQAIAHLEQVAEDEAKAAEVGPPKAEPVSPTMTDDEVGQKQDTAQAQTDQAVNAAAGGGDDDPEKGE